MTAPAIDLRASTDAAVAAREAANFIAERLRIAAAVRDRASLAISGGRTPTQMLRLLAAGPLPWERLHLFQVDERVAPAAHPERNAQHARVALAAPLAAHPERFHWMPVEAPDLAAGARDYAHALAAVAGTPPEIDIIQLGLGDDGHTASIFADAPDLESSDDVAVTPIERGWRRMTLTIRVINHARSIVWLVTGRGKREVLARLRRGDPTIVASRVRREGAVVFADIEAAPPGLL
jgi:6-phosphogluconolactonase